MAEITRRHLAALVGSAALAAPAASPARPQTTAQNAAPRNASDAGDALLQQQREAMAKDVAALRDYELAYGDEPLFRLVVR